MRMAASPGTLSGARRTISPARRRIDGGKVIESRCGIGNTCGRREADGEGGEGAGCYSGPWGLLTSFGETRNVEVAVGGHYCPGECVQRGVHGRTPARTGTTPCSRASEPRSGSHLAAVQDRHHSSRGASSGRRSMVSMGSCLAVWACIGSPAPIIVRFTVTRFRASR